MARMVAERADTLPALAETFREHGYAGASLALLCKATGLGKGSLYHFFPGGKEEMAAAVLADIKNWFEGHIFTPLQQTRHPREAIDGMFRITTDYFRSGQRICLVGMMGLSDTRDVFAQRLREYFLRWIEALSASLTTAGIPPLLARELAEESVAGIQGAITLARATHNPDAFIRVTERLRHHLSQALPA